jgi:BirA family biotin operon repressor/biotin-[acetyl-CoA-carboxylase] ligase
VAGRSLKKSVLELGGSDPFIVLSDADVDEAAHVAARARTINSGQSCIAAKRFIAVEPIAPAFTERLRAALLSPRTGLVYATGHTGTAAEVWETRRYDCLSLVVLFVAMAREAGLDVIPGSAGVLAGPDEAARQAPAGAQEGTVVVAATQAAGRARLGRSWVSRPGNLYLTIVLRPTLQTLPFLSCLAGVAVVRALAQATGLQPRLRWPNDVLLRGRKVAGILVESAVEGDRVRYALVGIGINVDLQTRDVVEIASFATSLNAAAGKPASREEVLRHLLQGMDSLYLQLAQGRTPLAEWKGLLDTMGRRVRVSWQEQVYWGQAEDVDELGNLQLRRDDGRLVTLASGDVTLHDAALG